MPSFRRITIALIICLNLIYLCCQTDFSLGDPAEASRNVKPYLQSSVLERYALRPRRLPKHARPTLDIVLGYHRENLTAAAIILDELWSMQEFQYLEKNIFVYVTNPDSNIKRISEKLDTPLVVQLDKATRESGMHLNHIARNYEHLARHTMFVPAFMNDEHLQLAKNRIVDYFGPNTGLLPLGEIESLECDVGPDGQQHASDTSIESLYYKFTNRFCRTNIAYPHAGEVIVSANRILSQDIHEYEFLKKTVGKVDDYGLTRQRIVEEERTRRDLLRSVEQSYMVMWGCGDGKLANDCGGYDGLKRRRRIMDDDKWCQCVDFELTL